VPLPEEFAPTGKKLSRFTIQPAPPLRPRLFPDEARFAFRLALLVFGTEFGFWLLIGDRSRTLLAIVLCRLLKPLWAALGRRVPRPAIAAALLTLPLAAAIGVAVLAVATRTGHAPWPHTQRLAYLGVASLGLPALMDLCSTMVADSVTVERRAAAYSWLEMGQSAGAALGIAAAFSQDLLLLSGLSLALVLATFGIPQLRDRGTPRSSWPLRQYASALRSPLGLQLCALAFLCTALAWGSAESIFPGRFPHPARTLPWWALAAMPLLGMALAARLEPLMPNAVWLPRIATLIAAASFFASFQPAGIFALGMMLAALPSAVARAGAEMERPLLSSVTWSALTAGAALGAVLRF
jgi:hypothetical protein